MNHSNSSGVTPPAITGPAFLRRREAAQRIGLAVGTLANMASNGCGPKFVRHGPRIVLYPIAELDAWAMTGDASRDREAVGA